MKTIEQEWQGFSEMVFRKTPAGEVQRAEMKKAFFAGAWSMFCAVEEIGMEHIPYTEGVAFLEQCRAECTDFKNKMMAEYAQKN